MRFLAPRISGDVAVRLCTCSCMQPVGEGWRCSACGVEHELRVRHDGEAVARQPGRVGVEDPDLAGPSIIVGATPRACGPSMSSGLFWTLAQSTSSLASFTRMPRRSASGQLLAGSAVDVSASLKETLRRCGGGSLGVQQAAQTVIGASDWEVWS